MRLRDGQTIFGALEGGDLAHDFGSEFTDLVSYLSEQCGGRPKAKEKGKITITVDVVVDGNGVVECETDITTKRPKKKRRESIYWAGQDGALLTQHPQQTQLDFTSRAAVEAAG